MKKLIQRLNTRRKQLGMSQTQLAARAGISISNLQRFLTGRRDRLSLDTVARLAEVLGMELSVRQRKQVDTMLISRARQKARGHVASSLTLPLLTSRTLKLSAMEKMFIYELMMGPKGRIWEE